MSNSASKGAASENVLELPSSLKADLGKTLEDIGSSFLTQGQALERLSQTYDEDAFREAIMLALNTTGHLIVIGMGKSGHIGCKIAATLASTGTPSFFVHPGEASHGDLGMITGKDVVIALSNSGETAEVVTLIPL